MGLLELVGLAICVGLFFWVSVRSAERALARRLREEAQKRIEKTVAGVRAVHQHHIDRGYVWTERGYRYLGPGQGKGPPGFDSES